MAKGIRIYDRYFLVTKARGRITDAVLDVLKDTTDEEQITSLELGMILHDLAHSLGFKYALREERAKA